ncbi:protein of unknown function [Cupriavidus taiwanensis]|uniref:Methyl-accepting transducer domain-containing protein n=1 Tax=Cupriavidus taiwanensis TaxID=164546 RepID=A0A7Z7JCJ7_9BURK|nr:protein of unknown function [Cupriavidus taiwanensis]SOZ03254.1 hypothetical protein CBM2597_A110318 [Cupriavidus taiwanensis]SOZ06531.1 hypothetical protein CBM2595_A81216 [Cupriavidus taiwanensis]SPC19060.1 hypothetical protein CBM2594_A80499 [Cupriavidus taiwanensis]SPD41635.1 protein of unknown function [Cupriavidus taiwanensis]
MHSRIVNEIAAASGEQRHGIEQVNLAVGQLDEVTQQNAALVEQASAATQSMAEQVRALRDAVAVFRLGGMAQAKGSMPLRYRRSERRRFSAGVRALDRGVDLAADLARRRRSGAPVAAPRRPPRRSPCLAAQAARMFRPAPPRLNPAEYCFP